MVQESPVEALKMRFVKGEITLEQYKEMLSVLTAPTAPLTSAVPPPTPSVAQASPPPASPPPSEDRVYIPPVTQTERSSESGLSTAVKLIGGILLVLLVLFIFRLLAAFFEGMGSAT